MRRIIAFGFGIAALAAALVWPINDARAEKPMAECKDGKCVVSEEDWKRFQEFYRSVQRFAEAMDKKAQEDAQAQAELLQKLYSCTAILEQRRA